MADKSKAEIDAQLKLLRWLQAQPSLKTAVEKAHKALVELRVVKIEPDDTYTADFLEFWAVYPKKVGKGDAFRKWQTIVKSQKNKELVIHSVETHKRSDRWKEEGGKYIPNPATFLHQRRFDDEVQTTEEAEQEQKKPKYRYEFDPTTNSMKEIPIEHND